MPREAIDEFTRAADQLKEQGRVDEYMKVAERLLFHAPDNRPVTKELAESFGLPKPAGALVSSVEKGSPAEKAGVEAGDVILKFGGKDVKNVIIADYTNIGDEDKFADIEDLKQLDRVARDRIEKKVSATVALELAARLPKTDDETFSMIRQGYDLARHMSWDAVVEKYVAPSLTKALKKLHHNKLSLSA